MEKKQQEVLSKTNGQEVKLNRKVRQL